MSATSLSLPGMDIGSFFFSGWQSLARIVVIAVPAYVLLVAFLNVAGKHSLAKNNAYGFVVTVALGSALASSVLSKQVSLADGAVAIALLLSLQSAFAMLVTRVSWAKRHFTMRPQLLVREGELLVDALRRERVREAEVLAAVRQHGFDSLQGIGAVVLETDGSLSVIPKIGTSPGALKDVQGASWSVHS